MPSNEKLTSDPQPSESDSDFFRPVLPPHLLGKNNSKTVETGRVYGPTLDDFGGTEKKGLTDDVEAEVLIGPKIPKYLQFSQPSSESEERQELADDIFGPSTSLMTTEQAASSFYANNTLPRLNKQDTNETSVKRETWMIELPEKKGTNFGLLARHFSTRVPTDKECDDSVWTDTPAEKKKKEGHSKKKDHKEILRMERLKERDKEMEKLAKKAAKKLRKKESLLEMHLKNMKKKKKKEIKKREKEGKTVTERRPFDRNVDLQIRKIDENQRRAILNKSQFLNDRFAAGQSRFL